jgi:outer membrane receptor protein involved in Fe transport
MTKVAIAFLAATFLLPGLAFAQTGGLRGTVRDDESGERLSGANLLLVGTTIGISTDLDGEYELEDVPAGAYDVRVSFMGYETKVISGVRVEAGDTEKLNVDLVPAAGMASFRIDDFVVSAERVLSTQVAIITERMRAITIGDGVSAEQIAKSPDGTSSDVLKRVTGLSVVDNKFVFVRGVTDRYNVTWLDGVPATSTDTSSDRRSFTFDVVPASLLANTVVVKTASPDLPGDFTGGLVQLNTRDIPQETSFSVSASGAFGENLATGTTMRSQGGDTDWLGMDDGIRELPDSLEGRELARALPNTWGLVEGDAPVNGSYSLSHGNRIDVGRNDGRNVFGYLIGGKYSSSYKEYGYLRRVEDAGGGGLPREEIEGTAYGYKVLWSGMANVSYAPSKKHRFTARALYVQTAREDLKEGTGQVSHDASGNGEKYQLEWDERSRFDLQLGGSHRFGRSGGARIEWKAFGSESSAAEPDRRYATYDENANGYMLLKADERTWIDLVEDTQGSRVDMTWPLSDASLKTGIFTERRNRAYEVSAFSSDPAQIDLWDPDNWWITATPIDSIFVDDNFQEGKLGFTERDRYSGEYEGWHDMDAWYGMVDVPFTIDKYDFRVSGGLRIESSNQTVESYPATGDTILSVINETDLLPSVNFTYMPTEWANVRLAYFRSVNRPELREMAPVVYHDHSAGQNYQGSANLDRAVIQNFDVRLEAFPQDDEVLAVSYFYKDIENAIEDSLHPDTSYRNIRRPFNSDKGHNQGFELEVRKNLGFLADVLRGLSVTANYTFVDSEIEYIQSKTDSTGQIIRTRKTRPLVGQSPWTVNVGLLYQLESWGTTVNVLYNRFGERLMAVTLNEGANVYEAEREVLDVAVTQELWGFMELKLAGRNLTGSDIVETQGEARTDHLVDERNPEYSVSLGLKW